MPYLGHTIMDIWPVLKNEKMNKVVSIDKDDKRIYVDHVTIRQSIFFLLLKLLTIEVLAGVGLIMFYTVILLPRLMESISNALYSYIVPFFIVMAVIKMFIMIFVVVQWLEEYYEIDPKNIVHKQGLIFRREERFTLGHLGTITLQQGILGSIFHYGTISLYDWVDGRHIHMYLIHNPRKYHKLLQRMVPEADKERLIFRQHIVDSDDQ
jgi:hypothetical protein